MGVKDFNTVLHAIPDSMALVDATGAIVTVNRAWSKFAAENDGTPSTITGTGLNYFAVCEAAAATGASEAPIILAELKAVLAGEKELAEIEYPCHSGTERRWFIARITLVPGSGGPVALVSHVNITQRKLAELKVANEARENLQASLTDPLTGLHNRRGLEVAGQELWKAAKRRGGAMAAVFVDLDKFKQINDKFGHDEGDRVLRAVANHLSQTFRSSDLLARVGGDEFVVLCWMNDVAHLQLLTSRLVPEISMVASNGEEYKATMTAGVAAIEPVAGDLKDLIDRADHLMYSKKKSSH